MALLGLTVRLLLLLRDLAAAAAVKTGLMKMVDDIRRVGCLKGQIFDGVDITG